MGGSEIRFRRGAETDLGEAGKARNRCADLHPRDDQQTGITGQLEAAADYRTREAFPRIGTLRNDHVIPLCQPIRSRSQFLLESYKDRPER